MCNAADSSTLPQLTGAALDAVNRVGQPRQVEIKQTAIGNVPRSFTVAPHQRELLPSPG
jgi:hypothetical protein